MEVISRMLTWREKTLNKEYLREEKEKKRDEKGKKLNATVKGKEGGTVSEEGEDIKFLPLKLEEVPKLKVERCKLEEIPMIKIKKEERVVSVPILVLQEPSFEFREHKLDCEVYRAEKVGRIAVPIIRVNPPPKLSILIKEFDTEIRKPMKRTPVYWGSVKVPIYWRGVIVSPEHLLESFDSTISEEVVKRLGLKKIPLADFPREKVGESKAGEPTSGGGEELQDFLEIAFEGEGGRIAGRGPKIILFKDFEDDSYVNFLESICLRIYRERVGGEPKPVKIRKIDDMNKREVEKWLEAGGKIFTVDLEQNEMPDETHLWERLEETYSEKLGFIIFAVRSEEKFRHLRKLLQRINDKAQGRINIIELRAKRLPRELIKLASGIIDLEKISEDVKVKADGIPVITTFDFMFNRAFFEQEKLFNEIKNEEGGLFKESTNTAKEESSIHFNLKVFLVRYLTHKLRKEGKRLFKREEIMKEIKSEEELAQDVIPDVRVGSEVYEVETLFGPHAGEEPDLKINRTVDKYDRITRISKVNIVMDNFGFLLHLRDLLRKKAHFRDKKFEVEFYTIDLQNKRLISLADFTREFKRVLERSV
ncbi:MAG: hypothetical protein QXK94_08375 [Candidatus Jordarchaeales archaeon]